MVISRDLGFDVMPSVAGSFSGPVVVCATGRCLWDDLAKMGDWGGDWMAVNDAGVHMKHAPQHWCTLHPEYFPHWQAARGRDKNFNKLHEFMAHSAENWPGDKSGTSSLFAVRVAAALGYEPIVLAGMPLDDSGHYYDPPGLGGVHGMGFFSGQIEHWKPYAPVLRGKVKVLSGNLTQLFGGI